MEVLTTTAADHDQSVKAQGTLLNGVPVVAAGRVQSLARMAGSYSISVSDGRRLGARLSRRGSLNCCALLRRGFQFSGGLALCSGRR